MRKEAVNTFNKGLVKDTHPLTTPTDVLTDCLNGTVITYNGNELILQNDMGNVLIGSAALPQGYIPVGITEYGGIIYVASYNPSTNKGLIGSFPSPQHKHGAEMWSVNTDYGALININIDTRTAFYANRESNDIIRTEIKEYVGLVTGLDGIGVNAYMLHTGDKISFTKLYNDGETDDGTLKSGLEQLLESPYLLVLFGILKSDGSIEIVEGDYLLPGEHVYTGKSSGYPIIIIKLLTLRSFNLERTYSRGAIIDGLNTVNVTFSGKVEKEIDNDFTNLNSEITIRDSQNTPVLDYDKITFVTTDEDPFNDSEKERIQGYPVENLNEALKFTVKNCKMEGELEYSVTPFLHPLGNLVTMKKTGVIDLSKFKGDTRELTNWSYLVLDNYVKINWSFDYYNLDSVVEFKQINFLFFDLATNNYITPTYEVEIVKDSFNGSFEEIINFNDYFLKNKIYIVRITAYKADLNGNVNLNDNVHIGNRMLYTSTIFNDYYGKVKDFTNKGFKLDMPSTLWDPTGIYDNVDEALEHYHTYLAVPFKKSIRLNVDSEVKVNNVTNFENTHITITYPDLTTKSFKTPKGMVLSDYAIKADDTGNRMFETLVDASYQMIADLKVSVVPDSTIIGNPAEATIRNLLFSYQNSRLICTDLSNKVGTIVMTNPFTDSLIETFQALIGESYTADPNDYSKGSITYTPFTFSLTLKAKSTDIKTAVVDKVGITPLYYSEMKAAFKDEAFSAWNDKNPLHCNGAGETDINYNGTFSSIGPSTKSGCDDSGLNIAMERMNLPMVSMFRGRDGDEACYYPRGLKDYSLPNLQLQGRNVNYSRRNVAGWGNGDGEIDGGDNFVITIWKLDNNCYRFGDLASQTSYSSKSGRLIRLDYMLRTLLSLIFTKQLHKNTIKYLATSSEEFGYYEPNILVETDLQLQNHYFNDVQYKDGSNDTTNYDILYGNETIEHYVNIFKDLNSYVDGQGNMLFHDNEGNGLALTEDELMTIKYEYDIHLIPKATSFGLDMGVIEVGNLMVGSVYKEEEGDINDGTDERYIYVIDWTAISNALIANGESLDIDFKDNSIFMLESDCTIKWKVNDMIPYLKLSGTKDGTGIVLDDIRLDPNDETSPAYICCNLYGGSGNTDTVETKVINGQLRQITTFAYDIEGNQGGVTIRDCSYGDVLRTWDGKKWPFYHSFLHMFITYCNWQDITLKDEELYNGIVLNTSEGYIGNHDCVGKWTDGKDENAPNMIPTLANSYNSIYGRRLLTGAIIERANNKI